MREPRLSTFERFRTVRAKKTQADCRALSRRSFIGPPLLPINGIQGTLAYAGIVQVDENEESMQALEGTRIPLVWYERAKTTER